MFGGSLHYMTFGEQDINEYMMFQPVFDMRSVIRSIAVLGH